MRRVITYGTFDLLHYGHGDWRRLPPEDKRKTAHEYIEIDLQKSWME